MIDKKGNQKVKSDKLLIDYAKQNCKLFCNHQGESYAKVKVDSHTEIWKVHSKQFSDILRGWYYQKTKRGLNKNSLESAISTISAIASYEGHIEEVYLRVAQVDDSIYIDMCDKHWKVIEVTNGGWKVLNESPIAFTRTSNMKPLPYPIGGNGAKSLAKHINIDIKDLPLLIGWMLMALQNAEGAYPVLIVNGPAGSGKSTACRMIRAVIDPNKADLISQPKISDLKVVGQTNHILAFDNVSNVSPQFSDAICKIATGDNQSLRKLYTDNEEVTISMKKPLILNGIPELAKRSDLGSRSLKLTLNKITSRKTEKESWESFEKDLPSIFRGILEGLSRALANLEHVQLDDMTRMADFCEWVTAARSAYDWDDDTFIKAYKENVAKSYVDSIESSAFASGVVDMINDGKQFHGRPLELLNTLEQSYVPEKAVRSVNWVRTAKGVIEQLDRNEEPLEALEIFYEKYKDRTNKTFIKLGKLDEEFTEEKSEGGHQSYEF